MALLASAALFEQQGGLYWNPTPPPGVPPGYRNDYPFFADRVNALKQRFAPSGQATLIAGCGWGALVQLARAAGYNAWGCDASAYAVGKAVDPAHIRQADVTVAAQLDAVATAAGLHGNPPRWDLLVTEDLLECLTDSEITTALGLLRPRARTNLLHIVSPLDPWAHENGLDDPRVNWKTAAQWHALLTPPDVVTDAHGNVI